MLNVLLPFARKRVQAERASYKTQSVGRPLAAEKRLLILLLIWIFPCVPARSELVSNVFSKYQAQVDKSVDTSLHYLYSVQAREGFFPGQYGKTTGVVALCGMAYLSKGYTPGHGKYGEVIDRCIDYVMAHQGWDGVLATRESRHANNQTMYCHNIATLFLSEVSGMVDPERQEKLDKVLGKAMKVIISAQAVQKNQQHRGGWRYKPDSTDSDLSCSGWALMALRSAKLNGAQVPQQAIEEAVEYQLRHNDRNTGSFGYQNTNSHYITLTGAGLLCLELCGFHGDDITLKAGDRILNSYHELPQQGHFAYGNYYNAQATFQLGGKYWEKYADWMYTHCLPLQNDDGSFKEAKYGTCYRTAMMVLAFTVPYRQLPIYQRDETVDEE